MWANKDKERKRVIKKIPKKKGCTETITQLRRQMILSLKNIFREPADKGEQRTMDTPSPGIILKNIDNFMRQWKTVEFINSFPLLSSSAVHEIEKLKGHFTKGCLSGIPQSGGANRSEALHRTLNKSLKRSRIGLDLALAFLGLFFFTNGMKQNQGSSTKEDNELAIFHQWKVKFQQVQIYSLKTKNNLVVH